MKLDEKVWHNVTVETTDDSMRVIIDGKEIGKFKSAGFAHASKDTPALVVSQKSIHFDDLVIRSR